MLSISVRSFHETDEQTVAALWRTVFDDMPPWNDPAADIRRKLGVQRELFIVATIEDRVIGTAMAGFDGHRGWVYYLAVHPHKRRQGVGRALMERVERDLAAVGCPKLNLQIRATNKAATGFYGALGYSVEDRISMAKRLGQDEIGSSMNPRETGSRN